MLATLAVILVVLALFVMSTLGSVLLVAFVFAKASFKLRVVVALLAGPGVLILPIMLLVASDGGGALDAMLGFSAIGAIACGFIGWPVAHLATKRLDRLIQFDVGTFE